MTIVAVQIGVPSLVNTPVPGNVPLVLITIVATLIANYLERESRLNYLQRLLTRIQGARLAAMVVQLHDLAQRDPLTGLANRRGIDAQFEALCEKGEWFMRLAVWRPAHSARGVAGRRGNDQCRSEWVDRSCVGRGNAFRGRQGVVSREVAGTKPGGGSW